MAKNYIKSLQSLLLNNYLKKFSGIDRITKV
jgi:hypothetical protein